MKILERFNSESIIMILLFGCLWDPGPPYQNSGSKSGNFMLDSVLQRNNYYENIGRNTNPTGNIHQAYPFTPFIPSTMGIDSSDPQYARCDEYIPQCTVPRGESEAQLYDVPPNRRLDNVGGIDNMDIGDVEPYDASNHFEFDIGAYNELVQSQHEYDKSRQELLGDLEDIAAQKQDSYVGIHSDLQRALDAVPNLQDESTKLMMEMDSFNWSNIFPLDNQEQINPSQVKPSQSSNSTEMDLFNEFFYPPEFDEDYNVEVSPTPALGEIPPVTPDIVHQEPSNLVQTVNVDAVSNDHEYGMSATSAGQDSHQQILRQSGASPQSGSNTGISAPEADSTDSPNISGCDCSGACSCSRQSQQTTTLNPIINPRPQVVFTPEHFPPVYPEELPSLDVSGYPTSADAALLKQLGIPIGIDELQELSQDQFIAFQKQHHFTASQVETIRAVRRRHKNKIAARNSRARRNIGRPRQVSVSEGLKSAERSKKQQVEKSIVSFPSTPSRTPALPVETEPQSLPRNSGTITGGTPTDGTVPVPTDSRSVTFASTSTNQQNPVVITSEKIANILKKLGTSNPPKALNIYTDTNGTLVVIPSFS